MFDSFLTKIFGSRNDRLIRQYRKRCAQINKLEPEIQALTDEQLRGKTAEFRERLDKGETLDALLPEAFAVVREASRRVLGMRHFDVQLIGGMVLNDGKIAEMRTGEGKTLTALYRLKNMEAALPADTFMRVHRSYIVNLRAIKAYVKGRIFLNDTEYVPIGENYKEAFQGYIDKNFRNL